MHPLRWLARGFQGLVTMLEDATREGFVMDGTTLESFRHWQARLTAVIATQAQRPEPKQPGKPGGK